MLRSSATQATTRVTLAGSRPASRPCRRLFKLLGKCRGSEDGVSAVEFGLFAPILFISLLAMVDLGLAFSERMTIDHVLRAGAQEAMKDPGADRVRQVLDATAAKNFAPGVGAPVLTVDYPICACPDGVPVACSTTCPGPTATSIFYHLQGTKDYEGMILPRINLGPTIQVQIR